MKILIKKSEHDTATSRKGSIRKEQSTGKKGFSFLRNTGMQKQET